MAKKADDPEDKTKTDQSAATDEAATEATETGDGAQPLQTIPVPSVGRIVHYVAWEPMEGDARLHEVHHAAIVTKVHAQGSPDSPLSLFIMAPTGTSSASGVVHDEGGKPGTWHWCEFVAPIVVEEPTP